MAATEPEFTIKMDLANLLAKYEVDPTRKIHMGKILHGKKPKVFRLAGDICTNGIYEASFGDGKLKTVSYSVGITLEEADLDVISHLLDTLQRFVNVATNGVENFEILDPIKDEEKLYLKLKTDKSGKSFSFKSNIPLTPKKIGDVSCAEMAVFYGEIAPYFNFEDRKCGLCFQPKAVLFDVLPENEKDHYPSKKG